MPMYTWESKHDSNVKIVTLRSVSAIDVEPTRGEIEESDPERPNEENEALEHGGWTRVLGGGTIWAQAPGYIKGGKGSRGGFNPKRSSV